MTDRPPERERKPATTPPESRRGSFVRNGILAELSRSDLAAVCQFLEPVALKDRMILQASMRPVEYVYFIESGVVSLRIVDAGAMLETAVVGRRGAIGATILFECHVAAHQAVVLVPGNALRIRVGDLQGILNDCPEVRTHLLRYVHGAIAHYAQTGFCGVRHSLEPRLACWLCLAFDAVEGHILPVTHEYLSAVLALRRAGVTEALVRFEEQGLIRKMRGVLQVNQRAQLEERACRCFNTIRMAYPS